MKKIRFLLLTICVLLVVSLTSCDVLMQYVDLESMVGGILGDALGHTCVVDEWEVITDPTCYEEGEEEGWCSICEDFTYRPIAMLDHTPEEVDALAPTCTEDGHDAGVICVECGVAISGAATIPAKGHTEEIVPAVEATETTLGKSEWKRCSECGFTIIYPQIIYSGNYADHNKYDGTYAYNSLASLPNGAKMQEFYREIDAAADAFHISDEDAKSKTVNNGTMTIIYAAEVTFIDNGITAEEARTAWNAYSVDHPLYYWLSKQVTANDQFITICVDEDYITAEARQELNSKIYALVKEYVESLNGAGEAYEIAKILHDNIIADAEYAYVSGTEIPSDEDWAHNIIGVMLNGEGVCESYAKTFQLLLNYCEVECIFATGTANGGAHAWNMVKLDNGEWYWYDLTWDDGTRSNKYFCVTEMDNHTVATPGGTGVNYVYVLPEVAETPYK